MIKTIGKYIAYCLFFILSSTFLLELLFRYQVFDFYQHEFNFLNPSLKETKNTNLIFGDSFSTYPNAYVEQLRVIYPEQNFVNAAISGTGILQHELLFSKRIKESRANKIIYQFYVGNDFLDISHPVVNGDVGLIKQAYWKLSEHILVLQYLNFKLAPINRLSSQTPSSDQKINLTYNHRTVSNFNADPQYLDKTLFLEGKMIDSYERWKKGLQKLMQLKGENCTLYLLMLPHCAQVHSSYLQKMNAIGAEIGDRALSETYPLYQQIQQDFPTIIFLDPLKEFRKAEASGQKLYFSNDPHLQENGQNLLAQYLANQLAK